MSTHEPGLRRDRQWPHTIFSGIVGALVLVVGGFLADRTGAVTIQIGDEPATAATADATIAVPAPTVTATHTVTASPAPSEAPALTVGLTYLNELAMSDDRQVELDESPTVDGREVSRSAVQRLGCFGSTPEPAMWNLAGRGYTTFTAWAGLDDDLEPVNARVRFTVKDESNDILDEVVLGNYEHKMFEVPIEGVSRLILEMEYLDGDNPPCRPGNSGVWGNAAVS
jgi:hypothetical protein